MNFAGGGRPSASAAGLRQWALASTALAGASLALFSGGTPWVPRAAEAACVLGGAESGTVANPDTGDIVTCEGDRNTTPIAAVAGSTDVTVIIGAGDPTLRTGAGPAIAIESASRVEVGPGGVVRVTDDDATAVRGAAGGNRVKLDAGRIVTRGDGATSVLLFGDGNRVTLDNGSKIIARGDFGAGLAVLGTDTVITLDAGSEVRADGREGYAIYTRGARASVTLRDGSAVVADGRRGVGIYSRGRKAEITLRGGSTVEADGRRGIGIYTRGDKAVITLDGRSAVSADGRGGNAILADGDKTDIVLSGRSTVSVAGPDAVAVGARGDKASIVLEERASVSTDGPASLGIGTRGKKATITLNGDSSVAAKGEYSIGVLAEGKRTTVTLNDAAGIRADANLTVGLTVAGDRSAVVLNGTSSIVGTKAFTGGMAVAGAGAAVTLNDRARIGVDGPQSVGLAIAVGGATVEMNGDSRIDATADDTAALVITGDATVVLNDAASIVNSGDDGNSGNPQAALAVGAGGVSVTIGAGASVLATGVDGIAIDAAGFCGGGAGGFELNNAGTVASDQSTGVLGCDREERIVNSGTIRGANRAIDLGGGDDTVVLDTGSNIEGTVRGGGGDDRLRLRGEGAEDDRFVGFERLVVDATGTWSLSGDSTFDRIAVNSGRLAADGVLTATRGAEIAAGAVLGGTGGIVGAVTNDGTVAPGNSVGTLTIDGDYVHNAGARLEIEVESATAFDQLLVSGTATLDGGALELLPVTTLPEDFVADVLVANGGVTGTFDSVASRDGATVTATYLADRVRVGTVSNDTFDGRSNATLGTVFSFLGILFNVGPGGGAGGAAGQVAGFGPTGVQYAAAADAVSYSDALAAAPMELEGRLGRVWLRGFGQYGSQEDQPNSSGYSFHVAGVAAGADYKVTPDLRLGGALGYSGTSVDVAGNRGGTDTASYHAAVYGEQLFGPWFVEAVLAGGYSDNDSRRRVVVAGDTLTARADFAGWQFGGHLGAGVDWDIGGSWTLRPTAVLDVVSSYSGAYDESGAGAGDLSVNEDWVHALRGGGKLRLSQHFETAIGGTPSVVEPRITVGLLREVPLGDRSSSARFAAFGGGFAIEGDDRHRTVATAGFGSDMRIGADTFLFADYEVEFADDRRAHLFTGGVRLTW